MSKLVNQSRLRYFATKLWEKIRNRYDEAFKEAEISSSTGSEKHITFKRISEQNPLKVSLEDYARLQDKNNFKQDVTVDNADYISTLTIGNENGPVAAANRTTGYRRLTNKSFTDGYISHLRVYVPPTTTGQSTQAHAWIIKKGETKSADTLLKRISGQQVNIVTSGSKKYFDISVNAAFEDEVFFVIRTDGQNIVGINNIQSSLIDDAININDSFNLNDDSIGSTINWSNYAPTNDKIGYMELHGRTGIVDINKKLKEIEDASGTYVKHSECTDGTGAETKAGKVVKLGTDGKLHSSLMPKIAINEYYTVPTFNNAELAKITYENGDVVVVASGGIVSKRYLCIDKENNTRNPIDAFVELNSKDGVVTSVNALRGDINLDLIPEEARIKLDIVSGNQTVTKEIGIITTDEIDAMITALS